ncbi:non-ribosomal peptide synthetase/type I polyketide synthase [Salinispora arenicola]|uniref:Phenolphthiocerol/phthiocerol polyketide synthase subunit E n=3 Tax=Salinispora arenicola TaxID=168697 RepID=A0A542XNU9_SALAC|nr:non-ribosomal peptide synthetase/type I polyketide synthase [Salinispora arenicola]TQL37537.1 amino acid adenylation domain-containing protein [Salinispora arenicola]
MATSFATGEPDPDDDLAIAVIGMACRFPGAADPGRFWHNLRSGTESVVDLDPAELIAAGVDPAMVEDERFVPRAILLDGIAEFDAGFFGFNRQDATILDPQHRLFLECAWHALEDAACIPGRFDGSIGVYAGASLSGYLIHNLLRRHAVDPTPAGFGVLIGNDKDYLPSRVSYTLDLDGPAIAVQSTCSTSLTAVHLAARALQSYECDVALAGGSTVRIPHGWGYVYREGSILSSDGHCRPFDHRANGTTVGSGAGVVVLKRLSDALADRDRIDAVLLGSAVNNDGASKVGYTAPSVVGQSRVIAAALATAGVSPASIGAIEAHGTGTQLGDPIEIAALTKVFGDGSDRSAPCLISSVKSNIGHLDSAAGVASLIKAVLQLKHGELVPNVGFEEPNLEIDLAATPFRVPVTGTTWKSNGAPRRVGVSSFGFGGTNVHAVLEEAPRPLPAGPRGPVQVITLSARDQPALDAQTTALADALVDLPDADLADVARTTQTGRKEFRHRRVVVVDGDDGPAEVAEALRDPSRALTRRAAAHPSVCWLFPGQGSQYPGMGAGLYESYPTYRAVVDECAGRLRPDLDLDLRELLHPADPADDAVAAELRRTRYAQPALFTVQAALAALLTEEGVRRDAMLGHSIGEITSAYLAGVFDLPSALRLVALRGRLMDEQPAGLMVSVALGESELAAVLPEGLSVAAVNAPDLCVVAGPEPATTRFVEAMAERQVPTRRLHTSHAFHSPMMRPVVTPFTAALSAMSPRAPKERFLSNRTGTWATAEQTSDPAYWAAQLLEPVRFADGIATIAAEGTDQLVLLEVGPGHTLTSLARGCPGVRRATALTTLRNADESTRTAPDATTLARTLGRLWLSGVDVDWAAADGRTPRRRVGLPGYAFQRRRYWVDGPAPATRTGADTDDEAAAEVPVESTEEPLAGTGLDPRPDLDTPFEAPRTDVERTIAAIWTDLLGVEPIGVHDSFLELGGHSLVALKVVQQMADLLGVEVPLRRLVHAGTVARLAEVALEVGADTVRTDEAGGRAGVPVATVDPATLHEPFPLSEIQQAQWIGRRGNFQLGNVAAHIFWEVEAEHLDVDRLQRAWHAVEERHPMLHAVVLADGQQRILPDVGPYQFPTVDLRRADQATVDTELADLRERLAHEMRPSDTWPLFEVVLVLLPDGRARVFLSFDLLIADIGSIRILIRDWADRYADPDRELRPIGLSYRDYVLVARQVRDTPLYQRSLDYWRQRITELPPAPQLPLATNPAALTKPRFVSRSRLLARDTWRALIARGARHGITPSGILLAAYGVVLGAWCRSGHLTMNVTMINRLPVHPDVDELVGEFASFDLLPIDLRTGAGIAGLAQGLQEQGWDDLEHRYVNGVEVLRELARARGGTAGGVMPVVFTSTLVQAAEPGHESLLGWLGDIVHEAVQTPQVWLDAAALEVPDGLYISWPAVDELFPAGMVDDLLDAYHRLLVDLAGSDEPWLAAPPSLLPAAHRELVDRANDTDGPVPEGLLHDRLVAWADQHPEAEAIVTADGAVTYGELVASARALAGRLRELGVGPGSVVAVAMPKSPAQVAAAVGVLIAGGAYLPLDVEQPTARQDRILAQADCRVVVCETEPYRTDWPVGVRSVGWPVGSGGVVELMGVGGSSSDVAYVIFTSGSTGEPKGVVVSHRAAVNTVVEVCERFGVGVGDRVLGLSSLSFDLSVFDVFGVLGVGGVLVLPGVGDRRDPAVWWELVSRYSVSVWNSVPALAQMFVDYVAGLGVSSVPLRLVLVSGDWVPLGLPGAVWSVAPGCRVVSLGGATEAAVWSIAFEVEGVDAGWESVPYGRPLRNQRFHVLNDRWQECPVYVVGELFIGGVGLADGYVGDAELTGRRFVVHPVSGERLYRTGDLGRWRPDGLVEFVGREDLQVKVGGYRIELGEIEQVLTGHPLVREAVVTAPGDRHHRRLVGYVQPGPDAPDEPTLTANVLEHLRQRLPAYMIPTSLVVLPAFPLTANGKVDRKALPDPAATAPATTPADAGDATAARLVTIVSEIIGVGGIDTSRSFFEFGGDSVSGVQIVSRANAEGIDLTLQDLFELQTIDQIAAALRARGSSSPGGQRAGEPFPLTAYQRIVLNREAAVATHRLELAVAADTDSERVRQVVVTLLDRHPALRLRMTRDADSRFQVAEAVDPSAGYVPFIGLGALPEARRREAADAMVEELAAELDPASGQVFSAALFDLGAPDRLLVCLAHRFAVDDAAWQVLVGEVTALLAGEALPPTPSARFESWATAALRDAPPEPAATGYAGEQVPAPTAGPPATGPTHTLPPAETGALVEAAATAYRMRPDEVLFAAALRSLASWARPASTGPAGIRVDLERDGRRMFAHLDADGAVGCFVLAESIPADLARTGDDVRASLLAAKDTYRTATPGHHGGGVLLRWLGELSAPPARPGAPPGLVVTGALVDGALVVSWDGTVAAADLRVLAEATAAELRRIAEHCATADDRVVGRSDFPLAGLDDAELATLLGNLDGDSA